MSNLLERASILLTPTAISAAAIHSIKPNTATGDFSFTRATTATRVNSSGLIEDVAASFPRIDFTGGTGHILMESASTNLEVNSADLSTSWSASTSATASVETGITPFGVSGNIKRVIGATNSPPNWVDNADALKKQYTVSATDPASTFTFSVYVKSAGSTTVNIQLRNNTSGPSTTTGVISLSSDWQRVSVTLAVTTTTTKIGVVIAGTDGDILLSGAQLEAKVFATSLIPTSGSTVTRNKDEAGSSGDSSLMSSTEGTIYAEFAALADEGTTRSISLSDGTQNNRLLFGPHAAAGGCLVNIKTGNVLQVSENVVLSTITDFNKVAIRYKANDVVVFRNGELAASDTSVSLASADTFTSLQFDSGAGFSDFSGKVKCIAVFKEFLDNDELECLTGSGFDSFTALAEAGSYTII